MSVYVTVKISELKKAVVLPKMKRGPRGAHGNIPKTTILNFGNGSLLVEAPTHTTALIVDGNIEAKAIVNAEQLKLTLEKLPQADHVDLAVDQKDQRLIIKVAALKVALDCKLLPLDS